MRRREYLMGLGTAATVPTAGCTDAFGVWEDAPEPAAERADARIEGAWPTHGFDAENTRRADAPGPVDELTGLWEAENQIFGDPIIGNSIVYTTQGQDMHVRTREAATGEWVDTPLDGASGSVEAIAKDVAVLLDVDDAAREPILRCVGLDDGTERWRTAVEGDRPERIAVVGSRVCVLDVDISGGGYGLVLSSYDIDDGTMHWSKRVRDGDGERLIPHFQLACDDDAAFVSIGDRLVADSITEGERLWTDPFDALEAPLACGPVVGDDRIIVGTDDGVLTAFDSDGVLDWQFESPSVASDLAVGEDVVYAGTSRIELIDSSSGERIDSVHNVPNDQIALGDGTLYATADGELSAIDTGTGEERATLSVETTTVESDQGTPFETAQLSEIAVVDDMLFVSRPDSSDDPSTVFAIGPDERH
ncbi:PQQ-binding-like beta-propeller repeat protein [Natranaeroarchaeum aerophilus]|uniref:PQQ-binding-like beta-propeller repeat protein n=1 Tax=Natranaeroarchaeum aerophilus TaxID=2917711 RepID=A0AAE3K4C6_9EURY|nr:PQQ-binding-like beta-propeller repeat protein [Natranaeroarchaeum aerophilus]MCL9813342.1 PQQ-binding-like beta-propeller repeat protein [Natranaeroarchaeum aerophilus]